LLHGAGFSGAAVSCSPWKNILFPIAALITPFIVTKLTPQTKQTHQPLQEVYIFSSPLHRPLENLSQCGKTKFEGDEKGDYNEEIKNRYPERAVK